jgi:hypothetical protein
MPTDPTKQISLFTDPKLQNNMASLASKLVTDPAFLNLFTASPNAALQSVGIPVAGEIKLSDRDKLVLKLIADRTIATLYKTGDIAGLRQYITANYAGLAVGGVAKADVAADFDVAIETDVVAVAEVAAVAVAVADMVPNQVLQGEQQFGIQAAQVQGTAQLEQLNAVLNARVAALEARVQMLEKQRGAA